MKAARIIGLLALVLAVLTLALGMGEVWLNPWQTQAPLDASILWQIRLPRLLTAFAVGGLLALAGAWFQVMLGNPLAEPYVLGVAGSASVGAVGALAFIPASATAMAVGASVGAAAGIMLVMAFVHLGPNRLLLAGVVMAAFWSACLALLLALMPPQRLGLALAWMMGDVSNPVLPAGATLAAWSLALVCGLALARSLDGLLLGEAHARALGIDVGRLRWLLLLLASLSTALAVTAAGTIGFVGLVVPHACRLIFGSLHAALLPATAVAGGLLLMFADAGARTLIAPAELPVGVLTALIGVPVFLWLLLRRA